jgi:3-methylfumaryl-CoA hydratase
MERKVPHARASGEIVPLSLLQKIAAMLDIEPTALASSGSMPRGWHFALLPSTAQKSRLRADGFAGLGVQLPDLGLPRLLQIERRVTYHSDIAVGDAVQRVSAIESIEHKGTPERSRAMVTVRHELRHSALDKLAVSETQTFMLMPEGGRYREPENAVQQVSGDRMRQYLPDATLLFHFSAIGFNAHKIHLDRDYARHVEGFPDLVVNGGLIALLVTEFARVDLGLALRSLSVRYLAPLFSDRLVTLAAIMSPDSAQSNTWQINVHDSRGAIAAIAKVEAE